MLDNTLDFLQHEFFIMTAGVVIYFLTLFAIAYERRNADFRNWFQLNKIWILLTFIVGLVCIVWDDEMLAAYNAYIQNDIQEIHKWMYFIAAPFITFLYRTFTSNFSNGNTNPNPAMEQGQPQQ
ncbi:MAG: hypothetical protein KDC80_09845 [Saprospiraceae bacterium]|nr:hypothetical protein [Saprospiraceae bacterium]